MSTEKAGPFRDLTFGGAPSDYRAFRRKILLSVAALEPKQLPHAGPRILPKLQGEAWPGLWRRGLVDRLEGARLPLQVPARDGTQCVRGRVFVRYLKRRPNKDAIQFVSCFKPTLSRLEGRGNDAAIEPRRTPPRLLLRRGPLPARAGATPPPSFSRR